MSSYDVIVIGAGMFGSSAVKHIRKLDPKLRVAIIGPEDNTNANARGQHHDEARITRRLETHIHWEYLNSDSMRHYREVEQESGIDFYTPSGCVWAAPAEDKDAMVRCFDALVSLTGPEKAPMRVDDQTVGRIIGPCTNADVGSQIVISTDAAVAERALEGEITIAHLGDETQKETYYIAETGPAGGGTVHPTRYVQAQLKIAEKTSPAENYAWMKEAVVKVEPKDGAYEITTETGVVYHAKKVVVATGYWCHYHHLLPERVTSRMTPQTVLIDLLRVQPPHGADHDANVRASAKCPCIVRTAGPRCDRVYCLPPRYYKEYRGWFMKMGELEPPTSASDVSTRAGAIAWYDGAVTQDHDLAARVARVMRNAYCNWPVETAEQPAPYQNHYAVRCMIDETEDKVPIIDNVDGNGWFSCVAGNGRGAKSCDAIGRIAAHRTLGVALPDGWKHYEGQFLEK